MYLSRLLLNPRNREVHRDLADAHRLHCRVMSLFPQAPESDTARAHFGVLFRLDTTPRADILHLLLQSRFKPAWATLPHDYLLDTRGEPANPDTKPVDAAYASLREGMALAFRLRANPTRKIDTKTGPDGRRRNGKRVDLRGEEDQIQWIRHRAEQGGFRLLSVRASAQVLDLRTIPSGKIIGYKTDNGAGDGPRLTFASVLFEGQLQVTDVEKFRQALEQGIGPGKAFGFGLLSLAPAGRGP